MCPGHGKMRSSRGCAACPIDLFRNQVIFCTHPPRAAEVGPSGEMTMKITIIGATGFVGSALLAEALSRGHEVTAIVRNGSRVPAGPTVREVDASDAAALEPALKGQDVVISAFNGGWGDPDIYTKHRKGSTAIAPAAAKAGTRLIVVGGAGSLYAPDGSQFVDSDAFPAEWRGGGGGGGGAPPGPGGAYGHGRWPWARPRQQAGFMPGTACAANRPAFLKSDWSSAPPFRACSSRAR